MPGLEIESPQLWRKLENMRPVLRQSSFVHAVVSVRGLDAVPAEDDAPVHSLPAVHVPHTLFAGVV